MLLIFFVIFSPDRGGVAEIGAKLSKIYLSSKCFWENIK